MQISHTIGAHPANRNFEERHATLGAKPYTAPSEPEAPQPAAAQPVEVAREAHRKALDAATAARKEVYRTSDLLNAAIKREASAGIRVGG